MDTSNVIDKPAAELANQAIARAWYDGIDLTYNGVNLADAITYDVLNVLGRAWLTEASKAQDTGRGETQ